MGAIMPQVKGKADGGLVKDWCNQCFNKNSKSENNKRRQAKRKPRYIHRVTALKKSHAKNYKSQTKYPKNLSFPKNSIRNPR